MPYEQHEQLITPADDTVLWRYMGFVEFVGMLENQALWFSRADQFEDPLEGTHTDLELQLLRSAPEQPYNLASSLLQGTKMMRLTSYINCWRIGPGESLAMWDLYGKGRGVVAIKTTVALLKHQLDLSAMTFHLAKVNYIDWNTATWYNNNLLALCARKDLSYQHEAEVRAIFWNTALISPQNPSDLGEQRLARLLTSPVGISLHIDCNSLITDVVLGPRDKLWVASLVGKVAQRYLLTAPISVSNRLLPR